MTHLKTPWLVVRCNGAMFDSPLEWCTACKGWIAIDQTFAECAREHSCRRDSCPLAAFFRLAETERPATASAKAGLAELPVKRL